ncbi:FHA domain-containing protein [Arthrobacter sp. NPDC090010]|uniref:FHA domain-containing protein n=1 Tax=Arthrobacter sp. NPDC090010 TaxID=3363942 RepID=UPI0038254C77
MTLKHYRQGNWLFVLRNGIAVAVDPDAGAERIHELWELLGRNPSVDQLLNEVTGSFGTSVTGLPDFAVVDHRGPLRLFLRGPFHVKVLDADGSTVDGREVTTWNERTLPRSENFELSAGEESEEDSPWLPLEAGTVPASALVIGELPGTGQQSAEPESATEGDAAPEPTPGEPVVPGPEEGLAPELTAASVLAADTEAHRGAVEDTPARDEESGDSGPVMEGTMDGQTDSLATQLLGARDADAEEEPGSGPDETAAGDRPEPEAPAGIQELPNDQTTTYDHLWDRTPPAEEEIAAEPGHEDGPGDGAQLEDADGTDEDTVLPPAEEEDEDSAYSTPGYEAPTPQMVPGTEASSAVSSGSTALPPAENFSAGLIDEVPWASRASGGPSPAAQADALPPRPPAPPSYPPVPASSSGPVTSGGGASDPDHDGHTVFRSELPGVGDQPAPAGAPAPAADGPQVLARLCPVGHANPPTRSDCLSCGAAISGDAVSVPRPALGRLRLPSGESVLLDRNVVLGRQPSVSRVSGGDMPHLIQLDSPKRDISRSHAEIRLEGWNVVLCDLNSSNGTVLLREGQAPRRLGQAETALVLSGDVAELGDQVYVSFEELP